MKRSVSSFFGQVSSVLNPSPDDEDEEAIVIRDSQPVVLTQYQVMLVQWRIVSVAQMNKYHEFLRTPQLFEHY
jgi:hypothetical protein